MNVKFVDSKTVRLDKSVNDLDAFVLRFIRILKKHVDYVIVSGYVSILFGRSRSTEDIDVFIKTLTKSQFEILYNELTNAGYWCLNAENIDEVYSYLDDGLSVRFANNGETVPNFEVKFAKKKSALMAFADSLTVAMAEGRLIISSLERHIAYKRYYLKSEKDLEDSGYIEDLFKEHIDHNKIRLLKKMIENELA